MLNFEMTFKNPYANFRNNHQKIWKREIENFSFLVLSIGFMAKLQKAAFLQKTYKEVRNTLSSKQRKKN